MTAVEWGAAEYATFIQVAKYETSMKKVLGCKVIYCLCTTSSVTEAVYSYTHIPSLSAVYNTRLTITGKCRCHSHSLYICSYLLNYVV